MASDVEAMDSDWAIEAFEVAARAMYVHKNWKVAIREPDGQHKDKAHYEAILGGHWDMGLADSAHYVEFRELAAASVLASLPNILTVAYSETHANDADAVWAKITESNSPWSDVKSRIRSLRLKSRAAISF